MIISNTKKVVLASLLVTASGVFAVPVNSSCGCPSSDEQVSCEPAQVQSPSWWDWLTSNKSSQFHFFQLMELMHNGDSNTSAQLDTEADEQTS